MDPHLSLLEARILGVLVEKELTVAEIYLDWRAEFEQLRAELQALRERVQQLENHGPLG